MAASLEESSRRTHLVMQQLRENEVLDGAFEIHTDRVVAITSERIMLVSGGGAKGWALTGIPWHVVTGVEIETEDEKGLKSVRVSYTARPKRLHRNGDAVETDEAIELVSEIEGDAERIVSLMSTRRELIAAVES